VEKNKTLIGLNKTGSYRVGNPCQDDANPTFIHNQLAIC